MLLRPILLHVDKYSEYISDRDTAPSEFVSKCAFSLLEKHTEGLLCNQQTDDHSYKDQTSFEMFSFIYR